MVQATQGYRMAEQIAPEQMQENAKTFLLDFAKQVVTVCEREEYEGKVDFQLVNLSPTVVTVEITFVPTSVEGEEPEVFPKYQMFVSKRYFSNNMVRTKDLETGEIVVMQAKPELVMAWLVF